jgi:Ran GTPase-activating protein (RanGAP) involved in mRNA processing and transport
MKGLETVSTIEEMLTPDAKGNIYLSRASLEQLKEIVDHLTSSKKAEGEKPVTRIHLNACRSISQEIAIKIANLLTDHNLQIKTLDLAGTNINHEQVKVIFKAIQDPNCKLTTICLDANRFGNDGAKAIAEAIKNNCNLTSILLSSVGIDKEGIIAIANSITGNQNLNSIVLAENDIDYDTIKGIADMLKTDNQLTYIGLGYCKITDCGLQQIADALIDDNCKLEGIDLQNNPCTEEGIQSLKLALSNPKCKITNIYVDDKYQQLLNDAITARGKPSHLIGKPQLLVGNQIAKGE